MAGGRRKQKADPAAAPPKRRRQNAEESAEASAVHAEEQNVAEEQPQAADEEEQAVAGVVVEEEDEDLINDMPIPDPPEPCMNADGSGARLMITKIEVENFKSYYGKQTLGPFHKNFTAIIGPNGSGKSNVIDSLLFVFGYRAAQIRSKKLSVLIHSSSVHDDVQDCTVAVHFQKILDLDRDAYRVVPNSQFFVSRTAWRNNSSKYTLNGTTLKFDKLATVLRKVGIDLIHNRFLILQGEVEQISLMKPKAEKEGEEGMLEYLEDIVGSSRLKAPIERLRRRLEHYHRQRGLQTTRLKHAEKQKAELDGPVKDVIEQLKVDNAIAHVQNKILSKQRYETQTEIKNHEPRLVDLQKEQAEVKEKLNVVLQAAEERSQARKELQKRLDDAQENQEHVKNELNERKQAASKCDADIKRLEEKCTKVEQDIGKEEKKITDYEKTPDAGRAKVEKLKETLEEAEADIQKNSAEVDKRRATAEEQTVEQRKQMKTAEAELAKRTAQEDQAGGKLTLAQEELHGMQNEEEKQRRVLAGIKDSLVDAERDLEAKKKELATATARKTAVTGTLDESRANQTQLRQREAQLADRQRDIRQQVGEKRQQAEQATRGNAMIVALMKEKQAGRLPGIFGRLGDLGGIDAKYDVAISTTCGALENIVVDCSDTAVKCINFLRQGNHGVATFIDLSRQEALRPHMANKPKTPEGVPRMYDLIRVEDERVLPAFYYALRDTLVADDIDAATRISNIGIDGRRCRVVTLKGEEVSTSGAMTGGGAGSRKGRIGRSATVNTSKEKDNEVAEIGRLEAELKKAEDELGNVRQQLSRVNPTVAQSETELQRLERTIIGATGEIENLRKKIESLRKQVQEQEAKVASATVDEEALGQARKKVDALTKERDAISAKTDELRQQVATLREEIDRIHESVVGKYQKALNDAETKKAATQKAISKEQGAINAAERNLKKSQTLKADLERDLVKTREKLEALQAEKKTLSERVTELEEDVRMRSEDVKKADEELKAAASADTETNTKELELQKQIGEVGRQIKEVETVIHKLAKQVADYEKQIGKLKLHPIHDLLRAPEDEFRTGEKEFYLDDTFNTTRDSDDAMSVDEAPAENMPELVTYSEDQIRSFDPRELEFRLTTLNQRKGVYKHEPNLRLLDDYMEKKRRFDEEKDALEQLMTKFNAHRIYCDGIRRQRLTEFMEGFGKISLALREMYQMITLGGDAALELVNTLDPFDAGIAFSVRPPKKSWKQMTNLSGGEKTLASLALVFALHSYKPTPLYVMDEIDAALDYRNVSIIGHYVKERTANAQFVIISLRNNMFERADRWVGICKVKDCTRNHVLDAAYGESSSDEDSGSESDSDDDEEFGGNALANGTAVR